MSEITAVTEAMATEAQRLSALGPFMVEDRLATAVARAAECYALTDQTAIPDRP